MGSMSLGPLGLGLTSSLLGSGNNVPVQAEATAFFARMSTQPDSITRSRVNRLVYDLKQSGHYATLTRLYLLDLPTLADSLLNFLSSSWTLNVPAGVMTSEVGKGLTGDGTSYLNAPGLGTDIFASNADAHITYMTTKAGNMNSNIGLSSASNNILMTREGGRIQSRLISANSIYTDAYAGVGIQTATRIGTTIQSYVDGVASGPPVTEATVAVPPNNVQFARHLTSRSTDRHAVVMMGTGAHFTPDNAAALSAALYRYVTAAGTWSPLVTTVGTLPLLSITTLPDGVVGMTPGKGFTCTGAALDPQDGTFWVCNYGQDRGAARTGASIVHCDTPANNFALIGEYRLATWGFADSVDIQGLAYNTSDNTLFAVSSNGSLIHFNKAGAYLGSVTSALNPPNGGSYDPVNDCLVINDSVTVSRINKTTGAGIGPGYRITPTDVDQSCYDATRNWLWMSYGQNGSDGGVFILDMNSPYGYPAVIRRYVCPGSTSSEGVVVSGNRLYVFNDRYFHVSATTPNAVMTYDISGI